MQKRFLELVSNFQDFIERYNFLFWEESQSQFFTGSLNILLSGVDVSGVWWMESNRLYGSLSRERKPLSLF